MDDSQGRIAKNIEEYDAQGWHRTGTSVDVASAEWLAGKLTAAGVEAGLEWYDLQRFQVESAGLKCGELEVPALPAFDGGSTPASGTTGRLGPLGSDAEIGLTAFAGEQGAGELEAARASSKHKAIVAITEGQRPGLQAKNATHFKQPFGPPVLYVSSEHKEPLLALSEKGIEATATAAVTRVPSRSANVVGINRGSSPGAAPVVVTTPRSGWWACASERGGGIAAWLEVAREVAATAHARDVWFVAFSGHEIGHYGLDSFLEQHPDMVERVKTWVHFGANVGGAVEPNVRVGASNAELLEAASRALKDGGVDNFGTAPAGRVPGLEPQALNAMGARCISLLGGNAFFHLEQDRWPEAVDVASVARQAAAFAKLVMGLAGPD